MQVAVKADTANSRGSLSLCYISNFSFQLSVVSSIYSILVIFVQIHFHYTIDNKGEQANNMHLRYAFITSRMDYCNAVLVGSPPKSTTDSFTCSNWQYSTCAECSSSSRHKHWQVRPRPVESTSWPVTLA